MEEGEVDFLVVVVEVEEVEEVEVVDEAPFFVVGDFLEAAAFFVLGAPLVVVPAFISQVVRGKEKR